MNTLQLQAESVPVQEAKLMCDGGAVADAIEEQAIGAGLEKHKKLSEQLGFLFT